MKKRFKQLLAMMSCVSLVALMTACAGNSQSEEAEVTKGDNGEEKPEYDNVTLVFSAGDCIGADEHQKPMEEWVISKLLRKFEEEHPGVKVELQVPADTKEAHTTFKTAALAGTAPDVANLWSGQNILSMKDALLCLNDYIPEEDMELFENANPCREGLKSDGDIYAYPFISKNAGFLLYNKAIIEEAGLDFEADPPRTLEEFYKACDAIKAAGYTPIWEDNRENQMFFYGIGLWWQQLQDSEVMIAEGNGEAKFSEDEALKEAYSAYISLYERGYVNENVVSEQDKMTVFYNKKAAMVCGGSWSITDGVATLGNDFGIMHFPDISEDAKVKDTSTGGIGETLVIPKTTKYPELAVELCSFLSSRESQIEILKMNGGVPLRSDITASDLGWDDDPIMEKLLAWGEVEQVSFPPAVIGNTAVGVFSSLTNKVMVGEMTVEELTQTVDEAIAETAY